MTQCTSSCVHANNFNIFILLHLGNLSSNYNSREVKRFLKEFHEVYLQQAKIINRRVRQPSQRVLLEIIQIQIKQFLPIEILQIWRRESNGRWHYAILLCLSVALRSTTEPTPSSQPSGLQFWKPVRISRMFTVIFSQFLNRFLLERCEFVMKHKWAAKHDRFQLRWRVSKGFDLTDGTS